MLFFYNTCLFSANKFLRVYCIFLDSISNFRCIAICHQRPTSIHPWYLQWPLEATLKTSPTRYLWQFMSDQNLKSACFFWKLNGFCSCKCHDPVQWPCWLTLPSPPSHSHYPRLCPIPSFYSPSAPLYISAFPSYSRHLRHSRNPWELSWRDFSSSKEIFNII